MALSTELRLRMILNLNSRRSFNRKGRHNVESTRSNFLDSPALFRVKVSNDVKRNGFVNETTSCFFLSPTIIFHLRFPFKRQLCAPHCPPCRLRRETNVLTRQLGKYPSTKFYESKWKVWNGSLSFDNDDPSISRKLLKHRNPKLFDRTIHKIRFFKQYLISRNGLKTTKPEFSFLFGNNYIFISNSKIIFDYSFVKFLSRTNSTRLSA